MGNALHHSSSEDSNSEHSSAPSYTSSPCQELMSEPDQLCQSPHRYHCSNHIAQSYLTHSYYKNSSALFFPSLYRGYIDEGRAHDMELSSMYIRRQHCPCNNKYYYEESPGGRLTPRHLELSRAPSLREYPQHPSRALPRQVISDELKSWHERSQLRPQSLQGAVYMPNLRDSPLSQHDFCDQVPNIIPPFLKLNRLSVALCAVLNQQML